MVEVNPTDLFEVRKESLFSSRDEDFLFDLYEPLIGCRAVACFLNLLHLEEGVTRSHESFLKAAQSSIGDFAPSLSALEATGLVVTYFKKGEKFNYFIYCLYAPRTPKEFFDNIMFVGTLRKYLDKDQIDSLIKKYALPSLPEDFENVSQSFREFFAPDLSDSVFREGTLQTGGRQSAPISTGFDRNLFLRQLVEKDPRFGPSCFQKEQMVKIARIAALYSYSEETMADFVKENYDFSLPLASRISFSGLEKTAEKNLRFDYLHAKPVAPSAESVHGDSSFASVVRSMDALTPEQFLARLQHGNRPASADLHLIHDLVVEMGLSQGACNALILYMIAQNGGVLSRSYMEKIAGGMVRAQLNNALDAMNYLTATKSTGHRTSKDEETKPAALPSARAVASPDEAVSDEEFNAMMQSLYTLGDKK